jgi:hypothetical protein
MARTYTKRSEYWNRSRKQEVTQAAPSVQTIVSKNPVNPDIQSGLFPEGDGQTHYSAIAACGGGGELGSSNSYRTSFAPTIEDANRYKNIRGGITPFNMSGGGYYSVANAIDLVMQAYWNVGILRNAINLLQDFSVSRLHIKTPNKTVKTFFENWFQSINLYDLMSQFFLEYYRSGNVFLYKFNGRIKDDHFNKLKTVYSAKSKEIPIRYIILNPQQVYLQIGLVPGQYVFSKMLSTYEIARLRNPQTAEDKMVYDSFPKEIQEQIKVGGGAQYIYAPLDPNRLFYAFYRKQDYEPLAIPMAFPVLNDIEYKLELKRMDQALARTVEQVILLVTAGEKPDEYSPNGYNPKILSTLQNMFKSQTIGRVLVADYTTKAEWKVPDLKEILGNDKYVRVDADIREGLNLMIFGDEKFANAMVKAKVFIESLREGRRIFLDNFLMLEVRKVCEAMGFKNVPVLEFEDIDIMDTAARDRLFVQMGQMGLLTPDELNNALENGILPSKQDSQEAQRQYKSLREDGLYFPLIGGTPLLDEQGQAITPAGGGPLPAPGKGGPGGGSGRPAGTAKPIGTKTPGPIGTSKGKISGAALIDSVKKMTYLEEDVTKALRKRFKVKGELSDGQKAVATALTKAIVVNEKEANWKASIAPYMSAPKDISAAVGNELDTIGAEFDVDPWTAIVLWRSQISE